MSENQTTPNPEHPRTEPAAGAPLAPEPVVPEPFRQEPSAPAAPVTPGPIAPAAPGAQEPVATDPVLDRGTYTAIREPRASGRLALDGAWHQISPKYVVSQTVQNAIFLALVVVVASVVSSMSGHWWPWIPAGVLILVTVITQLVLPRQARALGYMLRADDLVFRKGILWQRMIAVPYGRMQLIDITHGPMDRAFGIAKLKMVTAAATTGVEIPGLGRDASEALRDTLIEVAETRRTGL